MPCPWNHKAGWGGYNAVDLVIPTGRRSFTAAKSVPTSALKICGRRYNRLIRGYAGAPMTQPKAKPRTELTNADYLALTPPANAGARYQLINGELIQMAGASDAHQVFLMWLSFRTAVAGGRIGYR